MACLYKRADSKFWWIEYIDGAGVRRQESTKCRYEVTAESRKARDLERELSARELQGAPIARGQERFEAWVPRLIRQRYSGPHRRLTRIRYEAAWRNLQGFFRSEGIVVPRQLTRQHVRHFIEWREIAHREAGVNKGTKNTALLEIKFLGLVMDEAISSGFASANPCHKLGSARDEPELKPQITIDEHRLITRLLKGEPEWMRVSYRIAWEQGCRLSETFMQLPSGPSRTGDVDLAKNILRLRTKGKKKRVAEVPLSPRLRPLFRRLLMQQRKTTYEPPKSPAKEWWKFFHRHGLRHLSFHSTRVSFITRCYEAGIPEPDVMRLCLHASTTVHRIYPRLPAASAHLQSAIRKVAA